MLPKFLIADNSQEAPDLVYVVHTEKPQCIIQCDMDGFYSNQKIYWIDEEPLCTDDIESLMVVYNVKDKFCFLHNNS